MQEELVSKREYSSASPVRTQTSGRSHQTRRDQLSRSNETPRQVLKGERRNESYKLESHDDCGEGEDGECAENVRAGGEARFADGRENGRGDEEGEGNLDCSVCLSVKYPAAFSEEQSVAPRGKASMLGSVRPAQKGTWNCVAANRRKYFATFAPYAARTRREKKASASAFTRASVRRTATRQRSATQAQPELERARTDKLSIIACPDELQLACEAEGKCRKSSESEWADC